LAASSVAFMRPCVPSLVRLSFGGRGLFASLLFCADDAVGGFY
jgi:hypothetical protein